MRQRMHGMVHYGLVAAQDLQLIGFHQRQLMIGEIHNLIGIACQGRRIAGDEVFPLTNAYHQRTSQPRGNDAHRAGRWNRTTNAIGAAQFSDRLAHGRNKHFVAWRLVVVPHVLGEQRTK